jgi:hypothetical protein
MPVGVADAFLLKIFFESFAEVDPGLIGEADQHKKHIGHFFSQIYFGV